MRETRAPGRRPSICPEMLEPKAAISTTWVPSHRCIANIVHGFSSKRTPERFRKLRTIPSTFARVRRSPILVVSDFNSRPDFEKCASASATVRISLFESRYKRGLPLHTPGSAFRMTISPFGPSCSAEYEPGSLSSSLALQERMPCVYECLPLRVHKVGMNSVCCFFRVQRAACSIYLHVYVSLQ